VAAENDDILVYDYCHALQCLLGLHVIDTIRFGRSWIHNVKCQNTS